MDEKKERVFAKGFWFERPHANAPAWVKGKMSVKVSEAIEWLEANKSERGYVNMDLLLAKDGEKLYFTLNDFQPKVSQEITDDITYPGDALKPEDIGF